LSPAGSKTEHPAKRATKTLVALTVTTLAAAWENGLVSSQSPFSRRGQAFPSLPRGEVLGTYDTYLEAQAVVDRLSKASFPVKQLSIVGNDLKTVERVTGKLTYARAAGAGRSEWRLVRPLLRAASCSSSPATRIRSPSSALPCSSVPDSA
jgi:hypothetical protein